MKIKEYVLSKIITIDLMIGITLYLDLTLAIIGTKPSLIAFFTLGLWTIIFTFIFIDWKRTDKRIREFKQRLDKLNDKYLIAETLDKPKNATEKAYYELIKEISRSAIEKVETAEHDKLSYADFVDSWVHEIKTPLTACSLIIDNGCDSTKLKREIKKADNLTDTILYYARLKTISKDTQISECSLRDISDRAIKDQMAILIAASVKIEVEGDANVYSDSKLVGFILRQLLVNTAKYCPGALIKINMEDNRLIYEDNGIGIPSYELSRVTERGFTGARYRNEKGTGMGLYIVNELCRQLHIKMQIESSENEYTKFTFEF